MTVRPTTPAERAQVRDVAHVIAPHIAAGESWLVILACVSRWFPGVSLRAALVAYVFCDAILAEEPLRPLPYRAHNGTGGVA